MTPTREPAVWFPTVRTGTGTDVFTKRLAGSLAKRGIRTEITWLPLRAEYAPWTAVVPKPPDWATIAHVNSALHSRFLPKRLPAVATIHHAMHHPDLRPHKGLARATYHHLWIATNERRVLRRADRVIAVSRFVADSARQSVLDVPMDVIYNGIDADKFRPGNRQRKPQEPFQLLYVGSWKKLKGVDLLAPIMRGLGNAFVLCYTGGEAAEDDKKGMPANMHDIGRLDGDDAVIAAMQNADALLFPSRSEGFGFAAAEAMACGLPVIATRDSSLVEVVEDGVTGVLCSRGDVALFVAAARTLAQDVDSGQRMASAARKRMKSCFSQEAMVRAYVDVYETLAAC